MTTEDEGLRVFAAGAKPESTGRPSVFSEVDQDDLIARIGTVDDDMASPFFKESLSEAEEAATQVFNIGLRLSAEGATNRLGDPLRPTGSRTATSSRAVQERATSPVAATLIAIPGILSRDNGARQVFILGGPAALDQYERKS